MKKYILLFYILTCCVTNNKKEVNKDLMKNNGIVISLHQNNKDTLVFDKLLYTDFPLYSYKNKFNNIYSAKLKQLHGFPKLDSSLLVTMAFFTFPRDYNFYKQGYLSKSEFLRKNKKFINDTIEPFKNLKFELNAVSGFKNNKQVVIVDANNNNYFDDDEILVFNKNFRNEDDESNEFMDSIKILNFDYQIMTKGKTYNINRKIQVFPYENHPHIYLLSDGTLDLKTNTYTLMVRLKDTREGKLKIGNIDYTFTLQGLNNQYFNCIIRPNNIKWNKNNIYFQKNYEYSENDTIIFDNKIYKLDSVSNDFSKLYLNKTNLKIDEIHGHRINYKSKNYSLNMVNNDSIHLFDISKKKYMLLDFWGTWCAPCKELTPDLKTLHTKYLKNVDIISVALDEDVEDVINYTDKNHMNWTQAFVNKANRKNSIIDGLNIKSYPTFILLDKNGKIIYRGGSESLVEIEKIVKKNN